MMQANRKENLDDSFLFVGKTQYLLAGNVACTQQS
jgi:hypothetical protein